MTWHVVTGDYPPGFTGGVAAWTERVCDALHRRGEPVVLHARGARGVGMLAEARHDPARPFPVHRLRVHRWNERQASAVARHLAPRLHANDRVLATTWPVAAALVEPCRSAGATLLVVAHGSEVTRLAAAPPALLALGRFARVGAVSRFLAERLAALGIQASVLPAPVDPATPEEPVARAGLLAVARCTPLKGLERVLALGQALGWPVTVVGEGPALSDLRRQARGLSVPVRFEGRLSWAETAARYRQTRLLAQLSREDRDGSGAEGLGLVVLEAIAHGAPAVVSAVGGLPEAVGPGLVLERPDEAEAAAQAVRRWLEGGERASEQAAWLAATHGIDRTVDALRALCEDGDP